MGMVTGGSSALITVASAVSSSISPQSCAARSISSRIRGTSSGASSGLNVSAHTWIAAASQVSVARQTCHDALDLAQERPHGIGAGKARETYLAQVVEGAGVVLEAQRQLAVEEPAGARLPLGEGARPRVGAGALLEVVAEIAPALDEGPEEAAHEEREVPHVAMEGARAGGPGRGRGWAEPEHLDHALEARPTRRAQAVKAVGARELGQHLGEVGGDGVVADAQLGAGAAREGEEEAQQGRAGAVLQHVRRVARTRRARKHPVSAAVTSGAAPGGAGTPSDGAACSRPRSGTGAGRGRRAGGVPRGGCGR